MESIGQIQFEFNQIQEAKDCYIELLPLYGDKMRLVISKHPYSSGIWIESTDINEPNPKYDTIIPNSEAIEYFDKWINKPKYSKIAIENDIA